MNRRLSVALICVVTFVITVGFGVAVASPPSGGPPGDAGNGGGGSGNSGGLPVNNSGGEEVGELNNTYPDFFDDVDESNLDGLEPLEQRAWAMFKIESLETDRPPESNARYDAVTLLNETVRLHRGDDLRRVESVEAFDEAHRALRRANVLEDEETIELSSLAVLRANRETAELAVEDAANLLEDEREDFDNPGELNSAETHLENARDAVDRAERKATERGSQPTAVARANAVKEYGNAWRHAQRVIDEVNEQTPPELRITTTPDDRILREGYLELPLQAVVTDTKPYEIDEATVRVNGDVLDTYELNSGTAPGSHALFADMIELDDTRSVVEVSVNHDGETLTDELVVEVPGFADDTYEITVEDDVSDISVDVTGEGVQPTDIRMTEATSEGAQDYEAGPEVRIQALKDFDTATVEIPIDDDVDISRNISVYKWGPEGGEAWQPVETEIDEDERVARADVDSFSFFSVFFVDNWDDRLSDTAVLEEDDIVSEGGGDIEPIDLMLVIDESGSMRGSRLRNTKIASKRFVGALIDDDKAGVAGYATGASLKQPLTTDKEAINRSIDSLSAGGLTNTGAGLRTAINEIEANGEFDTQEIILLSDGRTNRGPNPVGVARDAADKGIVVNTIGVGSGINEDELRSIAGETGGDFFQVETAEDLPDVFDRVAEREIELVDSDDDGIPNAVEEMNLGMPVGSSDVRNQVVDLDPLRADTLGDGVLDEEAVDVDWQVEEGGEPRVFAEITHAVVNPGLIDTSGNGLPDFEELNVWDSNPLLSDTSGDGYEDFVDPRVNENSKPPDVQLLSPVGDYEERVTVFVDYTDDIDEVVVDGNYPRVARSDVRIESRPDSLDVERDGDVYSANPTIDIEKRDRTLLPDQLPEWYWVNVTGADGDATNLRVNPQDGGVTFEPERIEAETAAAPAVGTTTGSLGTGALVGIGAGAVAALVQAGSFEEASVTVEKAGETIEERLDVVVPPTATEATYSLTEPTDPLFDSVQLSNGQVIEEELSGETFRRGSGISLIEAEDVTAGEIEDVVENPDEVIRDEDDFVFIGSGGIVVQGEGDEIIRADDVDEDLDRPVRHDTDESMCNTNDFYVETDNERGSEGNPEHTLREEKPINDLDKLDKIIKNPDRILDYNERRYILKKFEDGVALIVMGENKKYGSKTVYNLITQLTDGGDIFESESDAFDEVDNNQEDENDITDDIDC